MAPTDIFIDGPTLLYFSIEIKRFQNLMHTRSTFYPRTTYIMISQASHMETKHAKACCFRMARFLYSIPPVKRGSPSLIPPLITPSTIAAPLAGQ